MEPGRPADPGKGDTTSPREAKREKKRYTVFFVVLGVALVFLGIASIGIVAAVALPTYKAFKAKSEFVLPIKALWELKAKMVDRYREQGAFPSQFESIDEIESRFQVVLPTENLEYHYEPRENGLSMTAEFTGGALTGEYVQLTIECADADCKGAIDTSKPEFGLDHRE